MFNFQRRRFDSDIYFLHLLLLVPVNSFAYNTEYSKLIPRMKDSQAEMFINYESQ